VRRRRTVAIMFRTSRSGTRARRSLETWRHAAQLVWARWEAFLDAPSETRNRAFAAYVAALDAEAAAAAEMAGASSINRA
jgi:hypothetical protein